MNIREKPGTASLLLASQYPDIRAAYVNINILNSSFVKILQITLRNSDGLYELYIIFI